jgi:DNA-binding NarL/FixJ family response regulator
LSVCFGFGNNAPESNALEQEKIRVLIANPTRIWRDMLYDTIREEPDIEVVGDVSDEEAIVSVTERTNPDCLIVPLDDPRAKPRCAEILAKKPHVRIVAIGEGADVVAIYWKSEEGNVRCTYTSASREALLRALHFVTS